MTGERLTRGELGWLLAQEARGAASALRAEVKELRASLRPPPPSAAGSVRISGLDNFAGSAGQEDRISSLPGERHLNALDEAINLLANLQQPAAPRSKRRGRIDLAALLYELAPNCKLSLEPGAGTEVIGDEHELRRMFHLLLNQSAGAGGDGATLSTIDLKRQDQWIHISVELGPDTAATSDLERRWLSRMAVKHGGRLELHGRRQVVILPAEASNREEVDQLKRELQQAQLLGEAYAKELATALAGEPVSPPESTPSSTAVTAHWSGPLKALATALLPALQTAMKASSPSGANEALEAWYRQLSLLAQPDEAPTRVNAAEMLSLVVDGASASAARRAVALRCLTAPRDSSLMFNTSPTTLNAALTLLVDHAIAATPTGGTVTVSVRAEHGPVFEVTDQGPGVPEFMAPGLVNGTIDPRSLGRPAGVSLLLASSLAERLGGQISLSSETAQTCVELTFK